MIAESATGAGFPCLHLGTSGWSYQGWRGRFYPAGLPAKGWLPFYAQAFNTVEINMTFYRLPTREILANWADVTPPGFTFTLKANRRITHLNRLRNVAHDVSFFYRLASTLGDKLGCILFQLPPPLTRDDALLKDFLSVLSPEYRNIVEFRDPSWYAGEVYDLLRTYRAGFCTVSSAKVPPDAVLTSATAYFRFHGLTGGYRHNYSEDELRHWAKVIRATGGAETFVYFNNDYQAFAVQNAFRLAEILRDGPGG
jgi:uncharacterized protein YecE (DUF72 family)